MLRHRVRTLTPICKYPHAIGGDIDFFSGFKTVHVGLSSGNVMSWRTVTGMKILYRYLTSARPLPNFETSGQM